MALADYSAFSAHFPEFSGVEEPQVQSFLDLAAESVPEDPWGKHQLEGHLYLTAHLLAQSPFGMNARLDNNDGKSKDDNTTYGARYHRLKVMRASGTRVV
jgi:hypothetical protein